MTRELKGIHSTIPVSDCAKDLTAQVPSGTGRQVIKWTPFAHWVQRVASVFLVASVWSVPVLASSTQGWANTATRTFLTPDSRFSSSKAYTELGAEVNVQVQVGLRLRNEAALQAMGQAVNTPGNPEYGHFLTRAQFERDFAPTPGQVKAVQDYLRNAGFTHIEATPNRLFVSAVGSGPKIRQAFNAQLVSVKDSAMPLYANTTAAQVPDALANIVLSVQGLQNLTGPQPYATSVEVVSEPALSPEARPLRPAALATVYHADPLPAASDTSLGIITQGILSVTAHNPVLDALKADYPALPVKIVKTGKPDDDYESLGIVEWMIDSQASVAAAGGKLKNLIFYAANINGPFNSSTMITQAFNRAVGDNEARVISVSLGWCEDDAYRDGSVAADSQIFALAVAQGQTFVIASGDTGNTCGIQGSIANGPDNTVDWPQAAANVISVGGTKLWTHAPSTYGREEVWNSGVDGGDVLHASGGGYSHYQARPSWQTVSAGPAGKRVVPDVAFDAASETGILLTAMNYVTHKLEIQSVPRGGTSLSAPVFAGFYARLQSQYGNKLGFAGPLLYQAGRQRPEVFHDVTVGNNGRDSHSGYAAGPGWDNATGWGSLDVARFSQYLSTVVHQQEPH